MRHLPSACLLTLVLGFGAWPVFAESPWGRSLRPSSVGTDDNWLASPFFPVGADHEVMSCLVHDGDLVISGDFATVDDLVAPGIARWDGAQWHAYPEAAPAAPGVPGPGVGGVLAEYGGTLTMVQAFPSIPVGSYTVVRVLSWNGTGWDAGDLLPQFVGGEFQDVPDRRVGSVVAWDGKLLLTPAEPGVNSYTLPEGAGPAYVAAWDGTAWSAFVDGSRVVSELEVWNGDLYAGGYEFTYDKFIDRWDGLGWTRLWTGSSSNYVSDFAVHAGQLFASRYSQYYPQSLLQWDGMSWSPYADPLPGDLLVSYGSELLTSTGSDVQGWNGSSWSPVGTLAGRVDQFGAYGGDLVAVGTPATSQTPAPYLTGMVSLFDGTAWDALGPQSGRAFKGTVEALHPYQGRLYAAGDYSLPGADHAGVAAWDGTDWEVLRENPNSTTRAAAMTEFDGALVVAEADGSGYANHDSQVAAWNGTSWSPLGSAGNEVLSLAVFNGVLVAGGKFDTMSGVPAGHIASWDGNAWTEVGGGVDGPFSASNPVRVAALDVWGNELVVAGRFESAGTKDFHHIASWNGSQWHDLEPPGNNPRVVTGPVKALAVYDGNLIASGSFWGTDVIASWDGHDWTPLGGGLNAAPQALYAHGGYLFASGETLTEADGIPVNRIAAWDGTAWQALGSGLEFPRPAAESRGWAFTEYEGHLYVGGNFRTAGGKASNYLAMWDAPSVLAVHDPNVGPAFAVRPGLPNPCRTSTRIPLRLPRAGRVTAAVFDIAGRHIGTILDRELSAGEHDVFWSPRTMESASGASIPAGTYFIRVSALGMSRSQKVVYLP